jgi:putative hydrolase of the HAD superfamily
MRAHDVADEEGWTAYGRAYIASVGVREAELEEADAIWRATFNPWLWRYPNPGAGEVLRALVDRGVPIGVVSNASGQIENVLRRTGMCQIGDGDGAEVVCVVDSHLVGVAKPDPAIFESALACLPAAPGRVAYVGDSIHYDVRGAEAAGLVPLHLDPYADSNGDGHERISALSDLLAWV